MFYGCGIKELDCANLDLPYLENAAFMFSLSKLESVNLPSLRLPETKDAKSMFSDCMNLTSVCLHGMELPKAENVGGMFAGCANLKSFDL